MQQATLPIVITVRSNARLLEALIALLSLKDEHLFEELKSVFAIAVRGGSEIGDADPAVWAEINRRLAVIDALIEGDAERARDGSSH